MTLHTINYTILIGGTMIMIMIHPSHTLIE